MIAYRKILPLTFIFAGVFFLMQVILPIVSFKIWEVGQTIDNNILISPQTENEGEVLGISISNSNNFSAFISQRQRDFKPNYSKFDITIPRLKVEDTEVFLDSNDLQLGLVHLPGSTLPGERGNVFISGHSAGSAFFSFKKVYFSKLADLKKNDEIIINAGGSKFVYRVIGLKVVDPKDLSVINPLDEQGRYITLMTCVPPGLNLKRLVVLGKIM